MNTTLATHPPGQSIFLSAFVSACRPRKRLTVSQWADENRVLTSKASSEPGPWRTARVPFAREIMDALSITSPVRSVTLMKASQVSGTEIGLNWCGYVMDHCPASMLVVVPTLDVRERWVKQRLDPMLEATPALAGLLDSRRRRTRANSEGIKDYAGGILIIGGANSPASLAAMPIKYVLNDEIDRFPWEVGSEGDPLELIRKRQQTFLRRKELNISSPTIKGASRIDELYEAGDQRRYHVPCPHCGELLVLHWSVNPDEPQHGALRWSIDPRTRLPVNVAYICGHCGAEIEEHHKPQMLAAGRWIPRHPERSNRSYHINGLYAPLGLGLRWHEMVDKWLKAQSDITKLKAFINTDLGEPWEDRSRDIRPHALMDRAEAYALREIPPGCLVLTCGVDVQGDRLEFLVVGWGRHWVSWVIDDMILPGDPVRLLEQAARGEGPVVDYLKRPFANSYGKEMLIEATAIDTGGHCTHEVYNFVRTRPVRRLMAVKGANVPNKPILSGRPQAQDVNWRGKVIKRGVMLWMVGTDTAKHALFDRLGGDTKLEPHERKVHFSRDLQPEFYDQLTAEAFDPEKSRWVKRRGRRNEALDKWVYAAAASHHPEIRAHAMRVADWDRLARLLEPQPVKEGEASNDEQAEQPKPPPRLPRRPGGFVNRWRK